MKCKGSNKHPVCIKETTPEDIKVLDTRMFDGWVTVKSGRQPVLTAADKRKAAAAAKRAHAQTDEAEMPIRQVLAAVDVDDDLLAIADAEALSTRVIAEALSTPVIPPATPKRQRPTAPEWLSAPQERPRHRNLDDWLNDDTQHQPGPASVADVAAGPGVASSRRGDEVGAHHLLSRGRIVP
jgi:hypothetical protein